MIILLIGFRISILLLISRMLFFMFFCARNVCSIFVDFFYVLLICFVAIMPWLGIVTFVIMIAFLHLLSSMCIMHMCTYFFV